MWSLRGARRRQSRNPALPRDHAAACTHGRRPRSEAPGWEAVQEAVQEVVQEAVPRGGAGGDRRPAARAGSGTRRAMRRREHGEGKSARTNHDARPNDASRADGRALVHHHISADLVVAVGGCLGERGRCHEACELEMGADGVEERDAVGDLDPVALQQQRVELILRGVGRRGRRRSRGKGEMRGRKERHARRAAAAGAAASPSAHAPGWRARARSRSWRPSCRR